MCGQVATAAPARLATQPGPAAATMWTSVWWRPGGRAGPVASMVTAPTYPAPSPAPAIQARPPISLYLKFLIRKTDERCKIYDNFNMCLLISSISTYIPRVPQCLFPRPNWDLPTRVSTEFRRHGIPRNFLTSEVISAQFRRNSAKFRGIPRNFAGIAPEITSVFRGMPKCHFRGHPTPNPLCRKRVCPFPGTKRGDILACG
jgi:hypothetical protein